jgi:hypothetical protein
MKFSFVLGSLMVFGSVACGAAGSSVFVDGRPGSSVVDAHVSVSAPDAGSDAPIADSGSDASTRIGDSYVCDPSVRSRGYASDAGLPVCTFGQTVCSVVYPKGSPSSPSCVASSCTDCACLCSELVIANCQYQTTSDGCLVLDGGFLMIFHDQI